jgi:ABC-type spermidine/putrescine transport system permease subunit I
MSHRRGGERGWALLALPGTAWILVMFVVPVYAIAAVAFGGFDDMVRRPTPEWNPWQWRFGPARDVWQQVTAGPLRPVALRTGGFVAAATALCLAVGYPVAYYVARHAGRRRVLLLTLLIVPFFTSYVLRMLAWVNLLNPEQGWAASALHAVHAADLFAALGLWDGGEVWLGQPVTVVFGLVYGYVPFFVLPLYAGLERIDEHLIEVARDLGATPRQVFWRVTFPLSLPAATAGLVITALPMFGDYYTNSILSGAANTEMIGNQIELMTRSTQPQRGAALVLMLAAVLLVPIAYHAVIIGRRARAVVDVAG